MLQKSFTNNLIEVGVDEVGRGCLAGPVVAAAVILPKDFFHSKLTDSKQLSAKEREKIKIDIENNALQFAISEVSAPKIDEINILQASFLAMHQALDKLTLTPELILVDGNRFVPYKFINHQCIVKGDSKFFSIAAASVLAKCYRDNLMTNLSYSYPKYAWQKNMGYPTLAHRKAIKEFGITPWHRASFRLLKE
ncbi:MAG: ribonuclease HII [Cytophagales bacterium]|nr:MAG: ribonuclease HII [Cytophagales bacterium]